MLVVVEKTGGAASAPLRMPNPAPPAAVEAVAACSFGRDLKPVGCLYVWRMEVTLKGGCTTEIEPTKTRARLNTSAPQGHDDFRYARIMGPPNMNKRARETYMANVEEVFFSLIRDWSITTHQHEFRTSTDSGKTLHTELQLKFRAAIAAMATTATAAGGGGAAAAGGAASGDDDNACSECLNTGPRISALETIEVDEDEEEEEEDNTNKEGNEDDKDENEEGNDEDEEEEEEDNTNEEGNDDDKDENKEGNDDDKSGDDDNAPAGGAAGTLLHDAACVGDNAAVVALLRAKAKVNAKDFEGWTPLHIAAQNGHNIVVDTLLQAKAAANGKESFCSNNE